MLLPWYKLTPFQLAVVEAWERGDAVALAHLKDAAEYSAKRGRAARRDRLALGIALEAR